ncbi:MULTISPECIES: thiamine kinase [Erwinia]|uniref:Thiamine kinase n=2 Tax=Erwinia TaxID=551 RepID=A0A014PUK9_9GAMM|nr:thiamine kinase [Erwinia mallotivora]EXU74557.1 thiamine kinase [Erwinia mallotivora]
MSYSIDPSLKRLIAQQFPAANTAGSFFPLAGLSGRSIKIVLDDTTLLARCCRPEQPIPGVDRRREYQILRKLAGSKLAPAVFGVTKGWLLLGWQPGDVLSAEGFRQQLLPVATCMAALHRQPLSGWRLHLPALLAQYWQMIQPQRRHCGWLKALRRLQKQGEPTPLRHGLLHMDIHAGNLVQCGAEVKLIDWEYACDGDVALELASVVMSNTLSAEQQQRLIAHYAALQNLDPDALRRQMRRWQPWLNLLVASWYELRWQQSGDEMFNQLAAESWQRVLSQ